MFPFSDWFRNVNMKHACVALRQQTRQWDCGWMCHEVQIESLCMSFELFALLEVLKFGTKTSLQCYIKLMHCLACLTCAGVPRLDKAPDDGATLVAGLLHTLALFLGKAVLQKDSQIWFILLWVLLKGQSEKQNVPLTWQ